MNYLKEMNHFIKYNFGINIALEDILEYISYLLYFIAFVLLTKYYWKTKFGYDPKFQTYVQVLIASTIIITVYSVYFQIVSYKDSVNNQEVQYFNNFYKENVYIALDKEIFIKFKLKYRIHVKSRCNYLIVN